MNCPNCQCEKCKADRKGSKQKIHRVQTIGKMLWNETCSSAAKLLQKEISAGKGGTFEDWERELNNILPPSQTTEIWKFYKIYSPKTPTESQK